MLNMNEILEKRKILDIALAYDYKEHQIGEMQGFSYPIPFGNDWWEEDNKRLLKWKNANSSQKPKYLWLNEPISLEPCMISKETDFEAEEIDLANGDVDFLSLIKFGKKNVLNFTKGEHFSVSYLSFILKLFPNLKKVRIYPDLDKAGFLMALSVQEICKKYKIQVDIFLYPFPFESKKDTNDFLCSYTQKDFDNLFPVEAERLKQILEKDKRRQWQIKIIEKLGEPDNYEGHNSVYKCLLNPEFHTHGSSNPNMKIVDEGDWFSLYCHCQDMEGTSNHAQEKIWDKLANKLGMASYRLSENAEKYEGMSSTSGDARKRLSKIARKEFVPLEKLIKFPISQFWLFGGMLKWLVVKKAITIMGLTGGFKTTFLRMMIENFQLQGLETITFSPEWDDMEHELLQAQAKGILTWDEYFDFVEFQQRIKNCGNNIEKQQLQADLYYNELCEKLLSLDAHLEIQGSLKAENIYIKLGSVEDVIGAIEYNIYKRRNMGGQCDIFVIDYYQMFRSQLDGDAFALENVVNKFKDLAIRTNTICLGCSQVVKDAQRGAEKGETLGVASGSSITNSPANAVLIARPIFGGSGIVNEIVMEVPKNSSGKKGIMTGILVTSTGGLDFSKVKVIAS